MVIPIRITEKLNFKDYFIFIFNINIERNYLFGIYKLFDVFIFVIIYRSLC